MSETKNILNIKETLFIIVEFLLLVFQFIFYTCEATYRLIVPKKKKSVMGEVVLVTGAGQGIGRELAIDYASLGATVICWDINQETNERTMNEIKKMGKNSVYAYRCDVSDKNEVFKVAEDVKRKVGNVTILINNAGIAPIRTFQNYNIDEISRVIDVNLMAHYWTMKAFLPNMISKNHGHIVAISSLAALHGGPHGTLYCTTKSAVRDTQHITALMECISEEVRMYNKGKSSVKFTTILPDLVTTDMIKNARFRFPSLVGIYSPQEAASLIINAQRQDFREKNFPSYCLPLMTIGRIFPKKAIMCVIDYLGCHFDTDD